MSQHVWYEHFKEKLQGLTEAFEQSGSPLSLLAYALKEQRLSMDEYLQWAMTHYSLPLLQSRFFTETPVSQEMFAKWATHYPWSTECLPVAEWDGSIIVACLHPPQDFPSNPSFVLVLSRYEDLSAAWTSLKTEKAVAAPTMPAPAAKAGEVFSFDQSVVAEKHTSASIEKSKVSENSSSGVQEDDEENQLLEGIFDGPTVVRLEPIAKDPIKKDEVPVEKESKTSVGIPTPPPPAAVATPSEKTVPPPAPAVAADRFEKTVNKPKPIVDGELTLAEAVPSSTVTNVKIPPPPRAKAEPPPPPEDSFTNKTNPTISRPISIAKPTLNTSGNVTYAMEKLKKRNSALINEQVKSALSEMKAYFDKSIILSLDDEETELSIFAWDESFNDLKDTTMRLPLKTPSMFNIVAATQKPFHGYISINEINERFFESWNSGKVPDHATIVPIFINERLVGMLMGLSDKSAYTKGALKLAEKLSTAFGKALAA